VALPFVPIYGKAVCNLIFQLRYPFAD